MKSVPEKEQKAKKIVEDLDEDDDDDDDYDEEEEEEIVTVAVKKSQGNTDKATKGGTPNAKSSSQKGKKVPEKSEVKDKKVIILNYSIEMIFCKLYIIKTFDHMDRISIS